MRWLIALLLLAQATLAEQVTIITWNLKWFPGGDKTSTPAERIVHMSAAKEALMDVSPDIICAQEIRNWEVFAELATIRPDLVPNVVSDYRDSPQGGAISIQQIGIASRMPAVGAWSESFRVAPESPPRGFSFIALQLEDGRHLLVYSVHLKSNRGDLPDNMARREEAAEQLVDHAAKMEEAYEPVAATVICGDFNTDPSDARFAEEKTFSIFESAGFIWPWRATPLAERVTMPSDGRYPEACFDGFVVKGDMRVVSCDVLPIEGVSDHKPVKLVLE